MSNLQVKQAFEVALAHMWDGKGADKWPKRRHICDALDTAAAAGELTWNQVQDAKDVIHTRIAPSSNVIDWLSVQGFITYDSAYREDEANVQVFRTRWCKELIKEFS